MKTFKKTIYFDIYILLHIYISYNIIKIYCYYKMFFGGKKKDICIYFLVFEGEIIIVKVIFLIEIFILFSEESKRYCN